MVCNNCGWILPDGASFCPGCGRSIEPESEPLPELELPVISLLDHTIPVDVDSPDPDPIPVDEEEPVSVPAVSEELPIAEDDADDEDWEKPAHPTTPRPLWVSLVIPTLILSTLFLFGTICYFLFPFRNTTASNPTEPSFREPSHPTLPRDESPPVSPTVGFGGYEPTDEDCFVIENGAVRFVPSRHDGSPILVIPETVNGEKVTALADFGFAGMEHITTLILPSGLKFIGNNVFENSLSLRGVLIPTGVETIGKAAFRGCIGMESIWLPSTLNSIGTDAFDGCASLMYLFYDGSYEVWMSLYNEYITPFTYACCSDGDYYHGVFQP